MKSGNTYRPDIQGLRAVAVALVVCAHANVAGLAGGFIGVDVFFVLSGFLITGLLLKEHQFTGAIAYFPFLARRLRRLLPALLTMLFVTMAAASLLLSAYETRMQSGSLLFSATWISNFFFALVDRDYFSALQSEDLFLHTWSLGVEEQFYIVWPWLLLAIATIANNGSNTAMSARKWLVALSAVFAISLTLCLYWSVEQPLLSFYMMPARGWQFALGAMVYVWQQDANRSKSRNLFTGTVGLALILASAIMLNSSVNYPSYLALAPSLGAAMIIAAGGTTQKGAVAAILESKPLVWLGDRSYSFYLWHWPILILGNSLGITRTHAGTISLVGLALLVAALSYKFIELPFWKGRWSAVTASRTLVASLAAVLIVSGSYLGARHQLQAHSLDTTAANGYDPRWDASVAVYTRGLGCDTGHFSTQIVPCPLGAPDADKLAVIFGDSIGAQWSSLITGIFSAPDWQVLILTKSACAMVDEEYYYKKVGANYTVCTEWRNKVLEYISAIQPDIVIVGSGAQYEFSERQWIDGSARVLARLSSAADQVVVIPGTPRLSFDGPSCLDEPYRFSYRLRDSRRECEEALSETKSIEVARYLGRAVENLSNTHIVNLNELVCPDGRCAARTEDGIVVFRDADHLTMSFVNLHIAEVEARLLTLGIDSEARLW